MDARTLSYRMVHDPTLPALRRYRRTQLGHAQGSPATQQAFPPLRLYL